MWEGQVPPRDVRPMEEEEEEEEEEEAVRIIFLPFFLNTVLMAWLWSVEDQNI